MQAHQSETDKEKKHQKTCLREALLRTRRELGTAERLTAVEAIANGVMHWWETSKPASLGVYWPIRGEPDLRPLYATLHQRGVQLALPIVREGDQENKDGSGNGDGRPLRFLAWAPGEALLEDRFGAAAPASRVELLPQALLIPCVGFNMSRIRLGYGGGFYDRTLARMPRPLTLGVAYDCAAVQFVGEAHDIALDAIVTESRLLKA